LHSEIDTLNESAVLEQEQGGEGNLTGVSFRGYLVRLFLWVIMVLFTVGTVGVVLNKTTNRYDFTEPKLHESLTFHNEHFDVIYFGDSLTLEGFNPAVIDADLSSRSYNFALGGASVLESEIQLRHFLRTNQKPRLVVLGIYINNPTKPAGVRPTLYFGLSRDLQSFYRDRLSNHSGATIDRSFIFFNSVPAYRYRNAIDLIIKSAVSRDDQRPNFVQGQARVSFSRQPYLGGQHESTFDMSELRDFAQFCREQQLPLLLIEPPNHPGYSNLTSNRSSILREIWKLTDLDSNVRFLSFDDRGDQFRADEWVNLNHLNEKGSVIFSHLVSAALEHEIEERTLRSDSSAKVQHSPL